MATTARYLRRGATRGNKRDRRVNFSQTELVGLQHPRKGRKKKGGGRSGGRGFVRADRGVHVCVPFHLETHTSSLPLSRFGSRERKQEAGNDTSAVHECAVTMIRTLGPVTQSHNGAYARCDGVHAHIISQDITPHNTTTMARGRVRKERRWPSPEAKHERGGPRKVRHSPF
ncbi:hypothetical protein BC827DRAFT_1223205 [Russula dissimulans]|nr:hypothetical protein BC827DRAFT_1223205 [Russula dissimulans]